MKNFKKIFGYLLFTLVLFLTLFIPQKSQAFWGIADISFDPWNFVQNNITAVSTSISAGSGTVTAVMTTGSKIKEFILDPAARVAMRTIIQRVTSQTVNWANSGFRGNPAFVTNPKQFFLNVGDNVASNFLSSSGVNQLCTPFRAKVRLALVKNYISEEQNYYCTLSILKNNYSQFTKDFTGGWDAWFEVTQNTQNNPYGAYMAAEDELNLRLAEEKNKYQQQLDQGRGFLSWEKCPDNAVVTAANQAQYSAEFGKNFEIGDCAGTLEAATPGSVIESQLQKSLGAGIDQYISAKNFDEVLGAVVVGLYNRVVGGGPGLLDKTPGGQNLPPPPTSGAPTIAIQGQNPLNVVTGTRLNDPGALAFDVNGTELNVLAISNVDTSYPGNYTITYHATSTSGLLVSKKTRTVIVGVFSNNPNSCLTQTYATYAATWPALLDLLTIKLGNVDEGQIKKALSAMISVTNAERVYLISQNQKDVIVDLEDILTKMDDLSEYADRADEDSIRDVLQLERDRANLKEAIKNLTAVYSCPVPPPTYTLTPIDTTPTAGGGGGGSCVAPSDASTRWPNHQGEVDAAKAQLAASGMTWQTSDPNFECNRFEITRLAAKMIGGAAGIYSKPVGANCNGYAIDIVAFNDGYLYDVTVGVDGAPTQWGAATCNPPDPSRWVAP